VVGRCIHKHKAREGVWAKILKPSRCGSISGTPSEMGMESGEGRWCSGVEEAVVVVGRCVQKHEAREGIWAKT
jgi:hypothetical protein